MKTLLGLQQQNEGLRRLAHIVHASLVDKNSRSDIQNIWPLPFDTEQAQEASRWQQRIRNYNEQKKKLIQQYGR